MDETAVRTIPTKDVVLAGVGSRYVHARVGNSDKESYTALFGASASGFLAPTLILYPYKQRIPGDIFRKLPQGWAAGKTETGWMNRDTFFLYLRDVFYPCLLDNNIQLPVILFVDGHKSHVSHLSTEFCKKSKIILVCLPANTTQITQPLDVCFFRPLKVHWNQLLVAWRIDNRGELLPKSEIAPLLKQAVDKMENLTSTLKNGFRRCGLYPFNPDSVSYSSLTSEKADEPRQDSRASSMRAAEPDAEHINHIGFLEQLEALLSPQQLQCFKQQQDMGSWTGPVEDTSLFFVWKRIRGERETVCVAGAEIEPLCSEDEEPPFIGFPQDIVTATKGSNLRSERNQISHVKETPITARPSAQTSATHTSKPKKDKMHPPSVATSKAYDDFVENVEKQKKEEEQLKQKKKNERRFTKNAKEKEAIRKKFDRFIKRQKK